MSSFQSVVRALTVAVVEVAGLKLVVLLPVLLLFFAAWEVVELAAAWLLLRLLLGVVLVEALLCEL